jgi:hypothetical protein
VLKRYAFFPFVFLILTSPIWGTGNAAAQSRVLAEIDNLDSREHAVDGFLLASRQTVQIDAVGAGPQDRQGWTSEDNKDRDMWRANAWILNADTRELVWDLESADSDGSGNDLRRFEGSVTLGAGLYEVHYATYPFNSLSYTVKNGVSGLISRVFNDSDRDRGERWDDDAHRDYRIAVRGDGDRATRGDVRAAARALDEAAVVALHPYRSGSERFGFELTETTDLDLLAIGELNRDGQYDYGWILDAESGDRVWEMDYYRSDPAGGGSKNRVVQEELRLPAGRYVAYFAADGSHDPEEWNTMPPFDPGFWGLTIWVRDQSARASVRGFEYEPVPSDLTFVSLTDVGDDELVSEGFSLSSPMDVRIFAIGEGTRSDMADYAWIVDANTRRRVWSMDYKDTEHAGGADKNRLSDDRVRLDAGSYLAYYRSDGSHSSENWNASAPAEAAYWGVSLYASSANDLDKVGPMESGARRGVIAELVQIGDNEEERVSFKLQRESKVRVIALGEGTSGEMNDGAWIEDRNTGRTVWEQTYRATDHAGGAEKNRVFDGTIVLPAGEYYLRYDSDGSHSYEDWNADPPNDPEAWGVTLISGD